jgi:hypothetical protein
MNTMKTELDGKKIAEMGISEEVSHLLSMRCKEKFALHGSRKDDLEINVSCKRGKCLTKLSLMSIHTFLMRFRRSTNIKIPGKGSNC